MWIILIFANFAFSFSLQDVPEKIWPSHVFLGVSSCSLMFCHTFVCCVVVEGDMCVQVQDFSWKICVMGKKTFQDVFISQAEFEMQCVLFFLIDCLCL